MGYALPKTMAREVRLGQGPAEVIEFYFLKIGTTFRRENAVIESLKNEASDGRRSFICIQAAFLKADTGKVDFPVVA